MTQSAAQQPQSELVKRLRAWGVAMAGANVGHALILRDAADRIEALEAALTDANQMCRSAYQVAARSGRETNWDAFLAQLDASLKSQLTLINAPSLKLHFTNDWLRQKIATDPDTDVKAGTSK